MLHLWYLCFMYGDLLWPDLDLEPSLISNIYSISVLPYILGILEVRFGPKLIILRSLRLVKRKLRFWLLTWPWPDVTSFGKFRGCFRIVSLRVFERRIGRLSAAIRSWVMTWGRLTPPSASRGWRNTPANAGLRRPILGGPFPKQVNLKPLEMFSGSVGFQEKRGPVIPRGPLPKLWPPPPKWNPGCATGYVTDTPIGGKNME